MPPKKNKVVEDKSFGMKNKKGGKAQKFLAQMANTGKSKEALAKEQQKIEKAKEKEREQKSKAELAELFKPVQVSQKVPFGIFSLLSSYKGLIIAKADLWGERVRDGPEIDLVRVLQAGHVYKGRPMQIFAQSRDRQQVRQDRHLHRCAAAGGRKEEGRPDEGLGRR